MPARAAGLLQFLQESGFQVVGVYIHLAGGNFGLARAVEAQLANAYGFGPAAHRRAKGAAGHRPVGVEVAAAGFRVERRTGFIVGEIREARFGGLAFGQLSGARVAWKIARDPGDGLAGAVANTQGALRIARFQPGQSSPQPERVELANGKRPDAALRAPQTADQPVPTLARRFGHRGIHDLDQGAVAGIDPR